MARKVGEIDKKTLNSYVLPTREKSLGTPTQERTAKEPRGFEKKIEKAGTVYREPEVSHKSREPVEVYRKHITDAEFAAALRFCKDCNIVFSRTITSRYDGMPSGGIGPRHGGVPDPYREAYDRFCYVLSELAPGDKQVLVSLVAGVRNEQTGQPTPIHQVALNRGVTYRERTDLSKVGLGLLKAALEHVHERYRAIDARRRQPSSASRPQAVPQKPYGILSARRGHPNG